MADGPRLAVRALVIEDGRLLLVNAYPGDESDLWCAPGGGVERHASLQDNLIREVWEETGLGIAVGALALVNEFHEPGRGFHQVDLFFRARVVSGAIDPGWRDPEAVVSRRRFATRSEAEGLRFKPDSLIRIAFAAPGPVATDPLELLVR